jgi:dihydroorotate dehydrogenase
VSGWRTLAYGAVRPLLFRFDSERIHGLTLNALRVAGQNPLGRGLAGWAAGAPDSGEPLEVAGLRFRNRVGIGAGFDKDGVALRGWAALSLGFAEVGTVTPVPQAGNPRPRLFRLVGDASLVNRMGFNNAGAAVLARNVMLARRHLPAGFVVGISIGRGRDTPEDHAEGDYLEAHRLVAPVADYLVVNVSSPNTPGLPDLQAPGRLGALVGALAAAGERHGCPRPIFVKLAPDLEPDAFDALVRPLAASPAAGLIVANTTVQRDGLRSAAASEAGGLSGPPLLAGMLERVARARGQTGSRLALIASGGIASAADAAAAIGAGADLVQLWTGLVYRGPGLIGEVARAVGVTATGGSERSA